MVSSVYFFEVNRLSIGICHIYCNKIVSLGSDVLVVNGESVEDLVVNDAFRSSVTVWIQTDNLPVRFRTVKATLKNNVITRITFHVVNDLTPTLAG